MRGDPASHAHTREISIGTRVFATGFGELRVGRIVRAIPTFMYDIATDNGPDGEVLCGVEADRVCEVGSNTPLSDIPDETLARIAKLVKDTPLEKTIDDARRAKEVKRG